MPQISPLVFQADPHISCCDPNDRDLDICLLETDGAENDLISEHIFLASWQNCSTLNYFLEQGENHPRQMPTPLCYTEPLLLLAVQLILYKAKGTSSCKRDTLKSPRFIGLGTAKSGGDVQSHVLSHRQDCNSKLLCPEWIKLG